jgi:ABC-type oligopeptide transport system substrate-binding subunit
MDIAQMMKQFNINPQQAKQVWAAAQQMGAGVKTKEQAMKLLAEKGIDQGTLQKIGGYINSPMADMLGGMMGVNVEKVRKDFNSLLNDKSSNVPTISGSSDILSKYRKGLKQL